MDLKQNIIIFSVFQKNNASNEVDHLNTLNALNAANIPAMELIGSYQGIIEKSILVVGFEHRDVIEMLCEEYFQDSYLESHNDRQSFLIYHDGRVESIGKLTCVSKEDALKCEAWSLNPETNLYYITK